GVDLRLDARDAERRQCDPFAPAHGRPLACPVRPGHTVLRAESRASIAFRPGATSASLRRMSIDPLRPVAVFAGAGTARYGFSGGHPFGQDRQDAFLRALRERGLDEQVLLLDSRPA